MLSLLTLAFFSAFDAFFVGFSYGLNAVAIRGKRLWQTAAWGFAISALAVVLAKTVRGTVPLRAAEALGGCLLILAGLISLKESRSDGDERDEAHHRPLSSREANLLGLGMALDNALLAFSIGLSHDLPWIAPPLFVGSHLLLLTGGNLLGRKGCRLSNRPIFRYLPALFILGMGAFKLLA